MSVESEQRKKELEVIEDYLERLYGVQETRKSQEIVQCRKELKEMDSKQLRDFMYNKLLERIRETFRDNMDIADKVIDL